MYPLTVLGCDEYTVRHALKEFLAEACYVARVVNTFKIVVMRNNHLTAYRCGKFCLFRYPLSEAGRWIIAISGLSALHMLTCSTVTSPPQSRSLVPSGVVNR